MSTTVIKRQARDKTAIVEQLRKTPIVQIACEKTGVGRATYYRWRKEDPEFVQQTDTALSEGAALVNDMAESQLMAAIRDQNLTAIIFWLKHHHPAYATKVEVTAALKRETVPLTDEQQVLLQKALELAALPTAHQEQHD